MVLKEDPELTSSHGHTEPTATSELFPSEKDLRARWTASTTKDKRTMWRWVEETNTVVLQNFPTPSTATHNRKASYQAGASPRGARGCCPTWSTSGPGICTGKASPQNTRLGKPMGLTSVCPHVLWEIESPLEGLTLFLLAPRLSEETAVWEVAYVICARDSFANLEALAGAAREGRQRQADIA